MEYISARNIHLIRENDEGLSSPLLHFFSNPLSPPIYPKYLLCSSNWRSRELEFQHVHLNDDISIPGLFMRPLVHRPFTAHLILFILPHPPLSNKVYQTSDRLPFPHGKMTIRIKLQSSHPQLPLFALAPSI